MSYSDYDDYDGPHDHGFDLPDTRHTFFTKDEGKVTITIVRHWYQDEDDRTRFRPSFDIHYTNNKRHLTEDIRLPVGMDEQKALSVAHTVYEEDEEATKDYNETEAIYAAERRAGA